MDIAKVFAGAIVGSTGANVAATGRAMPTARKA